MTFQQKSFAADTTDAAFLRDVLSGLSLPQKAVSCSYLYDERGSDVFEQITNLPEYYPTRTEIALLQAHGPQIAARVGGGACVVEFGSGSSRKTELLLATLDKPTAYIPMDISPSALFPAAERIQSLFPAMAVQPILGSFDAMDAITLPKHGHRLGFFPGSTIGNFTRSDAVAFLQSARTLLGKSAQFLLGADLKKPLHILIPAYNDSVGVTAAFNLNLLTRINRELGANFDLAQFDHEARYNADIGRIEMHLRARRDMVVTIAGRKVQFVCGETIHTENSHKYSMDDVAALAREAGWSIVERWQDGDQLFSLHLMQAAA